MSEILVTVTSPGNSSATIDPADQVNATVASGGSVAVSVPGLEVSYEDLADVPATFPPATHSHKAADISDRSTALVTSVNGQTGDVTIAEGGGGSSYTLPTATDKVLGGVKIGSGVTITDGVISVAGSSLSLSDASPEDLGSSAAGTAAEASRADHVHAMPTAADVGALDSSSTIDGGDYIGQIVTPGDSISITVQPANQTSDATTTISFDALAPNFGSYTPTSASLFAFGDKLFAPLRQFEDTPQGYTETGGLFSSDDFGSTWSATQLYFEDVPTPGFALFTIPDSSFPAATTNGSAYLFVSGLEPLGSSDDIGRARSSTAASLGSSSPVLVDAGLGSNTVKSLAYNASAGRWVALLPDGKLYSSSNGSAWTQRLSGGSDDMILAVFCIGQLFVAVNRISTAQSGVGGYCAYSSDGISWTTVSRPYQYGSAAASPTRVVALPAAAAEAHYTSNGATWNTAAMPVLCSRIAYAEERFWAWPSTDSTDILSSVDGVTWTIHNAPLSRSWKAAAGVGGSGKVMFLAPTAADSCRATITNVGEPVSFAVSATASNGQPVSYQWQSSSDAGSTWQNVAGETAASLAISNPGPADNGMRYRVVVSATGTLSVTSSSATLTVT